MLGIFPRLIKVIMFVNNTFIKPNLYFIGANRTSLHKAIDSMIYVQAGYITAESRQYLCNSRHFTMFTLQLLMFGEAVHRTRGSGEMKYWIWNVTRQVGIVNIMININNIMYLIRLALGSSWSGLQSTYTGAFIQEPLYRVL